MSPEPRGLPPQVTAETEINPAPSIAMIIGTIMIIWRWSGRWRHSRTQPKPRVSERQPAPAPRYKKGNSLVRYPARAHDLCSERAIQINRQNAEKILLINPLIAGRITLQSGLHRRFQRGGRHGSAPFCRVNCRVIWYTEVAKRLFCNGWDSHYFGESSESQLL